MTATGTDTKPAPVVPIIISLLAGAAVGRLMHAYGTTIGSFDVMPTLEIIGTWFINLLKMLIVPLILASVITAVAAIGSGRDLGRIGLKTISFYVVTTLIAVLIALMLVNIVEPGLEDGQPVREKLALTQDTSDVTAGVMSRMNTGTSDTIRSVIPSNIVDAAAKTQMLGLIIFAALFGFYLARIPQPQQDVVSNLWQGIFMIMMRITELVMRIAPIGVFALIAKVVAVAGFQAMIPLLMFTGCVLGGLVLYAFLALPLLLLLVARVNPWRLYPAMAPALLTAFSTASSQAALPLSLECLDRRAGVSQRIARFVMPLGASMNHAGSALYECAAAMFIAQAYGLHLSFGVQFTVVILALVTSMGMAGIPAASLFGIALILTAVGLPAEAIAVLLVFDRLLDMCRTAVNVLADAACTVIVARLEGETEVLAAPVRTEKAAA